MNLLQSIAACLLGVSTVSLSRWERDEVYPTWEYQPRLASYLGYDPFANPELGAPKSNETQYVANFSAENAASFGFKLRRQRLELRKNHKEFAATLGIHPKTLGNWETNRRSPSLKTQDEVWQKLATARKSPPCGKT